MGTMKCNTTPIKEGATMAKKGLCYKIFYSGNI